MLQISYSGNPKYFWKKARLDSQCYRFHIPEIRHISEKRHVWTHNVTDFIFRKSEIFLKKGTSGLTVLQISYSGNPTYFWKKACLDSMLQISYFGNPKYFWKKARLDSQCYRFHIPEIRNISEKRRVWTLFQDFYPYFARGWRLHTSEV